MISVPEQTETRRASRYDAVIATLVGLCALCVSAYTAYVQRQDARHRTIALADRAIFVLPLHVVVEISTLGWRGHQRVVHRQRYVEIAIDPAALKLYLKHTSDGVVSD